MSSQRSEKHEQARSSLPDELRPIFDDFVADYRYAATKHHGAPYVSYVVLAEMVRAGWRLVKPHGASAARKPE
jgi:hypothetical protein